ncbi:unnamed protein product [Owenia fusiformis]|uniref:Uncharacterized protein n=1 Tax=Owenia fusiformis TaxID=6347 RepID=A0A8J1TSJ4_OWEFU|nr:unnamed protein product [Owenia fusiformis]
MENSTNLTEIEYQESQDNTRKQKLVVLSLKFILALWICLGNTLVIIAYSKFKSLRSVTNYWILHLAVADLFMGLSMFIEFGSFFQRTVLSGWSMYIYCAFLSLTINLSIFMTISLLVAVTVDRYIAIFWPLRYQTLITMKKAHKGITILWSSNIIVILTAAIHWRLETKEEIYCQIVPPIIEYSYIPGFLAAAVIIVTLYVHIFTAVYNQAKKLQPQIETSKRDKNIKKNLIILKTAFFVIGIFLISWVPSIVTYGCMIYGGQTHLETVFLYIELLAYGNSGINPIIYAWRLKEFRRAFCALLHIKHHVTLE